MYVTNNLIQEVTNWLRNIAQHLCVKLKRYNHYLNLYQNYPMPGILFSEYYLHSLAGSYKNKYGTAELEYKKTNSVLRFCKVQYVVKIMLSLKSIQKQKVKFL